MTESKVRCSAWAARCECVKEKDHTDPHLCGCQGSWTGRWQDETFAVVEYPALFWGGGTFEEPDDDETALD